MVPPCGTDQIMWSVQQRDSIPSTNGLQNEYPKKTPLGYMEYLTWLQQVVPDDMLPSSPEIDDTTKLDIQSQKGNFRALDVLRELSAAARKPPVITPIPPVTPTVEIAPPEPELPIEPTPPEPIPPAGVPPLTEKEKSIAKDSLYGKGAASDVLASRFNVELTRRHLLCLRPREWLNDEVINFYFKLLQERSNKQESMKCWFASSFFWSKLSGDNSAYSYKDVKRWTTKAKVDIFALDSVVFPMNISSTHWALGVIDVKNSGFRYFDSMSLRPGKNFVPFLRQYICDEHKAKKGGELQDGESWDLISSNGSVPQQKNGYDCGVFTCFFADRFSAQRPMDFCQDDMPDLRLRLAARVVQANDAWDDG